VVQGGPEVSQQLLQERFDKIFFTGSTRVGRLVALAAAEHLTPVTLELGGKSPAIVCADADLDVAARRLVWGKFLNAGQTCVAPDYLLVERSIAPKFKQKLVQALNKFYEDGFRLGVNYTRIVSRGHWDRLVKMMTGAKVIFGGKSDPNSLLIEPTLIEDVSWESPLMQEEIFGPLWPILNFDSLSKVVDELKQKEKPLALYLFTKSDQYKNQVFKGLSFGGGSLNDTIMHLANPELPFGGVGASGLGAYHGEAGFLCFSHQKSILEKSTWIDPDLRYPPYSEAKLKWFQRLV
jgi:aldehyde dehydrogenase (NAD+)